jgi:hypothetical protein
MRTVDVAALVLLISGCGSDVITEEQPANDPYDGPLHVRVTQPDHPDPLVSSGAAGKALECSGDPYSGSTGDNFGSIGGHGSAVDALESFVDDEAALVPSRGYRAERKEERRVLFSYDVDGRTKVAIIVADEHTDVMGETGWSMETFAQCDPAEFPAAVTDELGIQIWVDNNGERIPTTVLQSARGPAHCEWDSATFLTFNGDTYVKDPQGVLPAEWFNIAFDADTTLPHDADDTGYRLDRHELWLAPDRSAAYIVTQQGVERWPAATDFVGCA